MGKTQEVLLIKEHGLAIPLTKKDMKPVVSNVTIVLERAIKVTPHSKIGSHLDNSTLRYG